VLTASDVLSDIEFELAQGAISHDDLGQGVQAVRQYQNQVRGEIVQALRRRESDRQIAGRWFQINDMLITLAQEMAAAIQSLRVDLRRVTRVAERTPPARAAAGMPAAPSARILEHIEQNLDERSAAEVEDAMRSDALRVGVEVQPARIPIVGGALQRLRAAAHGLVIFYVGRLAQRQVMVNQTYGGRILRMMELLEYQRQQIEMLSARVRSLEERLAQVEPPVSSPGDVKAE